MLFAVRTIHEEKGESVMSVFFSPREVIWGTDVLGELSVRLRGFRKAAIIIGASGSVVQNGSLERLCGTLQLCGMSYVVIDGIRADPTYKQVCEKARILTETRPDCLIALGGGSVIDAAKVMRLRHLYPDADLYTLVNPQTFPTAAVERPLPLIAIPTTSGTGSEITGGAVITDDETMTKLSISNPAIIPELAVVDASFAASMPRALAANTGMDALTHAIEAYLSIASSPMTDPLALQSSAALLRAICSAVDGNAEAREQMHLYQAMAALAFGSAGLGVVHGIAHAMGARFHIPHGRCNAILLPYALEYNAKRFLGGSRHWPVPPVFARRTSGSCAAPISRRSVPHARSSASRRRCRPKGSTGRSCRAVWVRCLPLHSATRARTATPDRFLWRILQG